MLSQRHIGLEIGHTEFRLVELRSDEEGPVFSFARVQQTEYNFGSHLIHEAPYNRNLAKSFIRDMTSLFHGAGLQAPRISVTLPASSILIATLPVDKRLSKAGRREQLQWECRKLYGYESDVEIDARLFQLGENQDVQWCLVAAMPSQTREFVKSVLAQMAFTISDLDVGHFVIENSITRHVPILEKMTYAVIGLYEEVTSVGIFDKGRYCGFGQSKTSLKNGYFAQTLRLVQSLLQKEPGLELEAVYVYGSATSQSLLESLRGLLKIPVKRYKPADNIPFLTQDVAHAVSAQSNHAFDIAVSSAVLNLQ